MPPSPVLKTLEISPARMTVFSKGEIAATKYTSSFFLMVH